MVVAILFSVMIFASMFTMVMIIKIKLKKLKKSNLSNLYNLPTPSRALAI